MITRVATAFGIILLATPAAAQQVSCSARQVAIPDAEQMAAAHIIKLDPEQTKRLANWINKKPPETDIHPETLYVLDAPDHDAIMIAIPVSDTTACPSVWKGDDRKAVLEAIEGNPA